MKSRYTSLGFVFTLGILSGCSGGNDTVPIIAPGPGGPTASAEEQRTPQSDALTSQEATLVSQGNSEPIPAPKPDL